mmetsp:Transcript_6700/g.15942  ORF Transcript_6700/g.15942 Transcript_6700/m.15942 type:complete len:116 (+) Transcript_6700:354-701(+)
MPRDGHSSSKLQALQHLASHVAAGRPQARLLVVRAPAAVDWARLMRSRMRAALSTTCRAGAAVVDTAAANGAGATAARDTAGALSSQWLLRSPVGTPAGVGCGDAGPAVRPRPCS